VVSKRTVAVSVVASLALLLVAFGWIFWAPIYDIFINPRFPPEDRSAEVARLIEGEYQGSVERISVRQVNDIRSGTDYPFAYDYNDWGYRATYQVKGSTVEVHMVTYGPEELTDANWYKSTFPSSIGVSVAQFVALLNAYAEGSSEHEVSGVASMTTAVVDTPSGVVSVGGRTYPQSECFVMAPETDDFGGIIGAFEANMHVVHLDGAAGIATYLGPYHDLPLN